MLQHLKHVVRAGSYNRSDLRRPGRLFSLVGAWYRNELSYARRTSRLKRVLGSDEREINEALEESREVMEYCNAKLEQHSEVLPGLLNPNYGPVLFALVRVLKPEVIVETGVGSGVSSTFFLSAMERNGVGRLHSVDLPLLNQRLRPHGMPTGWLVPDDVRSRWQLSLGDARDVLVPLLERLEEVDFFFHDSDPSYEHMTWEYSLAYPHIRPGGLLLSDDTTSNQAWDEFTSQLEGLNTRINWLGIARKAAT